ncbi:Lysyl oxidase-like protein 2 [Sciurus carolinensis]|uniref:Lysyl oxidase homolog 2 n=1 Tax=Sciurus carolinensis TaxID=30640 RepID=A0AA41MIT2_SCICA|nr:Lysyl oxidase-like protein 2 [Sciurus carolinensis]
MERPVCSCLCSCLALLAFLPSLSLAQYESWPYQLQYPEYFQQPAPEYHRPQVPSDVVKIQVRLAGQKRKHSEGRVEVYYDGQWGTVCDDDFSIHAAHVVCRELGYVEAKSWTASSSYGKGEGPIWLDNVHCTGKEATLAACSSNGWGVTDCKHTEDVGVNLNIQVEDIRIRPILSAFRHRTPVTEGYVEVKEGKAWRQICDKHWTAKNSHVVCGMFGFPGEKTYNAKAYKMFASRRKQRYWRFSMNCTGTETHISSCKLGPHVSRDPVKNISCENGQPAVVSCVPGQVFSPDGPSRFRKAYKPEQPLVRLRGGAQVGEGRVEVLKNGEWGTVCDDKWDLVSASVVCRELGFGTAKEAVTGSRLGQGMGPIHLNEVQCTGTEKSIIECKLSTEAQGCNHEEDAGVRCNIPIMGFQKKLRLNGGRNPYEGRVEVLTERNGSLVWGTVCGENWGIVEAMVVCRQLGLGFASNAFQETWYWHGNVYTNKVVMSGVKCSGTELSLAHCRHDEDVVCPQGGVQYGAGVACSETAPDLVLNAEMVQQTAYLEDRPMFMLQCAMEENCLSASAAQTNPTTGYRRLLRFSSQIHNNGQSDFRPKNGRHAWIWHDCHRHYHSMEVFTHYDLLNLNGTKVAEGHKASFCLEDTECEGDIQKNYECANFGEQGITMGCWDMYRHDIDCQWIDITDVPPGDYLFQVVINPNYEVPESDFSNNIMKCRSRYDGHRIWMYNCHIDKEEKSPCTTTRDTVCQCKPGTFQDPESPEYCLRCTPGCTNGLVEESPCVPWSDRKCVHKESAYAVYIVIGVVLAMAVALVILWKFAVLRRLCARAKNILRCGRHCEHLNLVAQHPPGGPEAQDNDHNENLSNRNSSSTLEQHLEQQRDRQNLGTVVAEEFPGEVTSLLRPAETEPSRRMRRLTPADGTDTRETLLQFFNCQQNVIPYQSWNKLMRQLGLTNNEIQVIKWETEDPGDVLYQMMVKWFNKMGRDATINSLLDALEILGERTAREKIEDYMVRSGKFIYQEDGADTAESFL